MFRSIGCTFKNLRHSLLQDLEADLHHLRYLFWETTRRCNLECRHCGSDCGRDNSEAGLDGDEVVRVLTRISQAYDAHKIMLVVTGGEPLARPDLMDILERVQKLKYRVGMVTNGIAMTEKRATALARIGLEAVVVSLDGPKECHDWLRARENAFERACNAITFLKAARVPIVEAITCVTPRSLQRLGETFEIVHKLGATHWRIFNIFPIGRAKGDKDLILDEDGIRHLVQQVAELRRIGKNRGVVVNLSEEGYLGWEWEKKVRDAPYFCRAGINIAGLLADGSIAACPNLSPTMVQGNVNKDDFVDVWENRYQVFRDRKWTRVGDCATCKEWKVCRGNSLHLWDSEENRPAWCHYKILHR